ncbi:hypothetical protein ARMGADRAFT_1033424 [Armillaria gallica]|uniref:CxC2-like cysteine cluster KDZ transposase-associated domain-containing protein n=1 Tax=Armillaria gallica TaxID=47427 RepID=A0A2H3DEV0_ARMGA|nr:hypothetical protein ARMGADRAFT_1033424 [Armillaria gallica]
MSTRKPKRHGVIKRYWCLPNGSVKLIGQAQLSAHAQRHVSTNVNTTLHHLDIIELSVSSDERKELLRMSRCINGSKKWMDTLEKFCIWKVVLVPMSAKEWNGDFYQRITLQKIGLQVQLSHPAKEKCTYPCPSAVTFAALQQFQMLSFMSKILAYEYYHTLGRLSDNTGVQLVPDLYQVFLQVVHEWRHIRMLK